MGNPLGVRNISLCLWLCELFGVVGILLSLSGTLLRQGTALGHILVLVRAIRCGEPLAPRICTALAGNR